jgi:hypothetical protein
MPELGTMILMNYRVTENIELPFSITPFLRIEGDFKLELEVELKNVMQEKMSIKQLQLNVKLPMET